MFTENPPASTTTTQDQTVTSFYALTTGLAPAPIMLRLGNSTIDSTKSFKVPQPTENHIDTTSNANSNDHVVKKVNTKDKVKIDVIPHVISAKNTYFDHDRRYGPTFEDAKDGNITKVTVQLGEDGHLNCRISLLQDKTVSHNQNFIDIEYNTKKIYNCTYTSRSNGLMAQLRTMELIAFVDILL